MRHKNKYKKIIEDVFGKVTYYNESPKIKSILFECFDSDLELNIEKFNILINELKADKIQINALSSFGGYCNYYGENHATIQILIQNVNFE